jgi:hypothetical protein
VARTHPLWKSIVFYTLAYAVGILLWPLLLLEIVKEARRKPPEDFREANRKSRIQNIGKGWLRNRVTVEEAEAKNLTDFSLGDDKSEAAQRRHAGLLKLARSWGVHLDGKPVPFGLVNRQWRELVASMQEWDELWEFSSSDLSWEHLAGRAGIALVRNGEIIDCVVTCLN